MYFVRRFSILVLCGVLFLTGCSFSIKPGLSRYDAQFLGVFDTVTSIVGYTRNEEEFTAYAKQLQEGLEEILGSAWGEGAQRGTVAVVSWLDRA